MPSKNITIYAPDDVLKAIDAIAKRRKRSRSFLFVEAAELLIANQASFNGTKTTTKPTKAGTR